MYYCFLSCLSHVLTHNQISNPILNNAIKIKKIFFYDIYLLFITFFSLFLQDPGPPIFLFPFYHLKHALMLKKHNNFNDYIFNESSTNTYISTKKN